MVKNTIDNVVEDGDEEIKCVHCHKTFASQSSLCNHKHRCDNKKKELENEHLKELLANNPGTRFPCVLCNSNRFTSQSGLSKHMKTCNVKIEFEKTIDDWKQKYDNEKKEKEKIEKELEKKDIELEKKDIELEKKDIEHERRIALLENDKYVLNKNTETIANLAAVNSGIISTSISAFKYISTFFKNPQPLEEIKDMTSFRNKTKFTNNSALVLHLIHELKNKSLANYIADYIVSIYRKDDPQEQSIWITDVNRMNYYISQLVDNDTKEWHSDKNGVKIIEIVIRPLLTYILPFLKDFVKNYTIKTDGGNLTGEQREMFLDYQKHAVKIITLIDNYSLEKDIIRSMAPKFFCDKNVKPKIEYIEDVKLLENKKAEVTNTTKDDIDEVGQYFLKLKEHNKNKQKIEVVSDDEVVDDSTKSVNSKSKPKIVDSKVKVVDNSTKSVKSNQKIEVDSKIKVVDDSTKSVKSNRKIEIDSKIKVVDDSANNRSIKITVDNYVNKMDKDKTVVDSIIDGNSTKQKVDIGFIDKYNEFTEHERNLLSVMNQYTDNKTGETVFMTPQQYHEVRRNTIKPVSTKNTKDNIVKNSVIKSKFTKDSKEYDSEDEIVEYVESEDSDDLD